ncbi:MAG: TlpA disulfide reductase family protein, partial [Bacteroidia bacterium]|nr:TlpA disulfide reductase family protein [Bacteroidia bacterium]
MRRKIFSLIAAMATMMMGYAQTTIEFNITDIGEGVTLSVSKVEGMGGKSFFRQDLKEGTFNYILTCDSVMEDLSYIGVHVFEKSTHSFLGRHNVYLNVGDKIHVTGSGNNPSRWKTDSKHAGQLFYEAMNTEELIDLNEQTNSTLNQLRTPNANIDSLRTMFEELNSKVTKIRADILSKLPIDEYWLEYYSIVSGEFALDPESTICKILLPLYDRLSEADKKSHYGKIITANIFNKQIEIGDKMQDHDLYDIDGKLRHLADYSGRDMLVEFGSFFCGPCRMATPILDYLYKAGDGSCSIVSVNNDTKNQFDDMMRGEDVSFPIINDREGEAGIFSTYKVKAVPTFYVFNKEGIVTDTWMGLKVETLFDAVTKTSSFKWATKVETT